MDQDVQNRLNFLEGGADTLETIMAEMFATMVSNQLVDADLLRRTISQRRARLDIRQYDDLIMGTPQEHYFKGAIQVLDKVRKELPG